MVTTTSSGGFAVPTLSGSSGMYIPVTAYTAQTPEEKAYQAAMQGYVGGLDAAIGQYASKPIYGMPMGGMDNSAAVQSYYAKPYEQNTAYQFHVPSNTGKTTGTVNVDYNTPVALYDYATGELIYSGVGFEAAEKVAEMAANLSSTGGRKAEWGIFTGQPGSTDPSTFKQVAYEKPNASTLGKIADIGLPIAGAVLTGGALAPLGAAAGSALSSVAQGRSLGDVLKRAAISAATTYAGGKAFGTGTSGAVSGVNNAALDAYMAPILEATNASLGTAMSQGLGALPSSVLGSTAGGVLSSAGDDLITVLGSKALGSGVGSVAGAGLGGASGAALTPPKAPTQLTPEQQAQIDQEIGGRPDTVVTAPKPPPIDWAKIEEVFGTSLPSLLGGTVGDQLTYPENVTPEQKSMLDKIRQYYGYGSLGLSALGAVAGALGSQKSPSSAGATGVTDPLFSAKLPEAGAGFGGSDFAARPVSTYGGTGVGNGMTMDDWLTYGMRPERSFFSYVPENTATIAEPVTPRDDTDTGDAGGGGVKPPRTPRGPRVRDRDEEQGPRVREPRMRVARAMGGYAAGGSRKTFAVEGAGTGRSDDIPAVLSDGEYVMDAETVALLGDGSSKAGAKKLDQFRVNVRKHKGSKLAKGRFSANAKRPEKYLSGGKA